MMVVKSGKRTFSVTVRPATPASLSLRPTASTIRTSSRRTSPGLVRSRAKVSSWPIDLTDWSGSTRRPSRPLARRQNWVPEARPNDDTRVASGTARSSATVWTPRRWSRSRVRGPTPHMASTGSGSRNSRAPSAGTTRTPLPGTGSPDPTVGFAWALANLARNLLAAIPTLHPRPSSSRTSRRMASATWTGDPCSRPAPATSRNASSRDNGSTNGV